MGRDAQQQDEQRRGPKFGERFNFEVRLEAFNVFNHPNFTPPGNIAATGNTGASLQSSVFGQLTSVVDTVRGGGINSRIMQWALRINF